MYTYRMSLMGALMMLGACSTPPQRPQAVVPSIQPPVVAAAPTPLAARPALQAEPRAAARAPVVPPPIAASAVPLASRHPSRAVPVTHPAAKAVAAPVAAPASATLQVSGRVALVGSGSEKVESGEQADTLVYFVPDKGVRHAAPGQFTVYTNDRDFSPEAMAVPLGSTVTFVNLDDVRHNVFSVTPGTTFDLGYQASGEKAHQAFGHAGLVLVSCNVHHSMELDILVVPSPYMVKVGATGAFTLAGLPAGPGTLHFWNPRARPVSQKLTLPTTVPVIQQIVATRPRMTTAFNEAGKR